MANAANSETILTTNSIRDENPLISRR
ncbi:hypothetical protein BN1723_018081, partial [Verticillium longisporum]